MRVISYTCVLISLVSGLFGCTAQNDGDEYLDRLSRVLEVERPELDLIHLRFPPLRDLAFEQKKNSISIKSFLGLRECRLHTVIAERNSQLGRLASASQKLFNDLKILESGPECLTKLENGEFKTTLSTYLDQKRNSLPKVLAHALLAQPEYKTLWQAKSNLENYPKYLPSNSVVNDLAMLDLFANQILKGDYKLTDSELDDIELALGRLRFGDAGHLLQELEKLNSVLEAANGMIKQKLSKKLCANTKPTPNSKYFQNVVGLYFIEKIQPRLVLLSQRFQQLMPTLKRFEKTLSAYSQTKFINWIEQRNERFEKALNAPREHAILIQALFDQCGIQNGNRTN